MLNRGLLVTKAFLNLIVVDILGTLLGPYLVEALSLGCVRKILMIYPLEMKKKGVLLTLLILYKAFDRH